MTDFYRIDIARDTSEDEYLEKDETTLAVTFPEMTEWREPGKSETPLASSLGELDAFNAALVWANTLIAYTCASLKMSWSIASDPALGQFEGYSVPRLTLVVKRDKIKWHIEQVNETLACVAKYTADPDRDVLVPCAQCEYSAYQGEQDHLCPRCVHKRDFAKCAGCGDDTARTRLTEPGGFCWLCDWAMTVGTTAEKAKTGWTTYTRNYARSGAATRAGFKEWADKNGYNPKGCLCGACVDTREADDAFAARQAQAQRSS
jgi:hypothetical protein